MIGSAKVILEHLRSFFIRSESNLSEDLWCSRVTQWAIFIISGYRICIQCLYILQMWKRCEKFCEKLAGVRQIGRDHLIEIDSVIIAFGRYIMQKIDRLMFGYLFVAVITKFLICTSESIPSFFSGIILERFSRVSILQQTFDLVKTPRSKELCNSDIIFFKVEFLAKTTRVRFNAVEMRFGGFLSFDIFSVIKIDPIKLNLWIP